MTDLAEREGIAVATPEIGEVLTLGVRRKNVLLLQAAFEFAFDLVNPSGRRK